LLPGRESVLEKLKGTRWKEVKALVDQRTLGWKAVVLERGVRGETIHLFEERIEGRNQQESLHSKGAKDKTDYLKFFYVKGDVGEKTPLGSGGFH